jgi:WD40 repeat protein
MTSNENGQVSIWNPKTADVIETFTGHEDRTLGSAFSADGKTLYTCSLDGAIFEWDLAGSRRFGRPFQTTSARSLISDPNLPLLPPLALSPDGRRFATRTAGDEVSIFSVATVRPIRSFRVGPAGPIAAVAWSPVADELAVAGIGGRVELWDIGPRPQRIRLLDRLKPVTKLTETINAVSFSPDGSLVAAVAVNHSPGNARPIGIAGAWRARTGKLVWRRVHRDGPADALAFAKDGKALALSFEVGAQGSQVQILDPVRQRTERTLDTIGGSQSLAFAPDGTLLSGSWAGIVQRWNVSTGEQLGRPVLAMPAPVSSISFDPTGSTFATGGGSGGFVKLWDTKTLQQLGTAFPGEAGKWTNAAFTPDGSSLITLYENGRGSVWPADIRAWKAHACRVAGRNLTREEWSRFISGRAYTRVCRDQR